VLPSSVLHILSSSTSSIWFLGYVCKRLFSFFAHSYCFWAHSCIPYLLRFWGYMWNLQTVDIFVVMGHCFLHWDLSLHVSLMLCSTLWGWHLTRGPGGSMISVMLMSWISPYCSIAQQLRLCCRPSSHSSTYEPTVGFYCRVNSARYGILVGFIHFLKNHKN